MSVAYYAKGMEIWKSPVKTENGDGTTSISIGFQCATATEIVGEEGAQAIAEMLTLADSSASLTAEVLDRNGKDGLTDCFRHHITTTIGWLAFGARPGPEMQMYEEGFKAGYRRCQSDNEPELGE